MLTENTQFNPLTVTYAITAGDIVEKGPDNRPLTAEFTYTLFQMQVGFDQALASAVGPVKDLAKTGDGIAPTDPEKVYVRDENNNIQKIELHHPKLKPFGTSAPAMVIQVQSLDEEVAPEIKLRYAVPHPATEPKPDEETTKEAPAVE